MFNFLNINDKEFELLCCDIFEKHFQERVERFKTGKDQGIDGRFYGFGNALSIIQCKHYEKSGFSALVSNLKQEILKLNRIMPQRYILATSVHLNPAEKEKLLTIFSPYIQCTDDIWGNEDLQAFLNDGNNSDIVRRHYNLWVESTGVLTNILNNDVFSRSKSHLQHIIEQSKYFVRSGVFDAGLELLEKKHTIIVSGAPGIGKTTLAEQLCLYYVAQEKFELIVVSDTIKDAEKVYNPSIKQIFYFDDFLGSNYLSAVSGDINSCVMKFIRMIKQETNSRLILTSRTNILNQGKRLSSQISQDIIRNNEFELKIHDYSKITKAKILYNHIWHSNLSEKYIDEIYINKRYFDIINHRNYNPRLIEHITDLSRIEDIQPENYWLFINKGLTNPTIIWKHFFDSQIDDATRYLMLLVFWNQGCSEQELQNAYEILIPYIQHRLPCGLSAAFRENVEVAVKSVLSRNIDSQSEVISYSPFNPSLGDYVIKNLIYENNFTVVPIAALGTFKVILHFKALKGTVLDKERWEKILLKLFQFREEISFSDNFLVAIIALLIDSDLAKGKIKQEIIGELSRINIQELMTIWIDSLEACTTCVKWLIENDKKDICSFLIDEEIILDIIPNCNNLYNLLELNKIIHLLKLPKNFQMPDVFWELLNDQLANHISQYAYEEIEPNDVLDECGYISEERGYAMLENEIDDILSMYDIDYSQIDYGYCISGIDIEEIIVEKLKEEASQSYPDFHAKQSDDDAEIEDLFSTN